MKRAHGVLVAVMAALAVFAGFSPAQELDPVADVAGIEAMPRLGPVITTAVQQDWGWCSKCMGLHYISHGVEPCPASGNHTTSGSGKYTLVVNDPKHDGQHIWRYCKNCQQLFWGGGSSQGVCPAGGAHDKSASGDYSLVHNMPGAPGQDNWRYCSKCKALWYAGTSSPGTCPAGGTHSKSGSGNYTLLGEEQGCSIWGTVADKSGIPVAGVKVKTTGKPGSKKATTAADGTYSITGFGTGKCTVTARKKGIGKVTKTVKLKLGDSKLVDLVLK